jgi:hypothetical protein
MPLLHVARPVAVKRARAPSPRLLDPRDLDRLGTGIPAAMLHPPLRQPGAGLVQSSSLAPCAASPDRLRGPALRLTHVCRNHTAAIRLGPRVSGSRRRSLDSPRRPGSRCRSWTHLAAVAGWVQIPPLSASATPPRGSRSRRWVGPTQAAAKATAK